MGKLGIFVCSDKHLGHVTGLTKAAIAKGNEVQIFFTGPGTPLAIDSKELVDAGAKVMMCLKTYEELGLDKQHGESIDGVESGSQDNNADMIEEVDRYVVF